MKLTRLINPAELSRRLGLHRTAISKNRCPQKHAKIVKSLNDWIERWVKENLNN